MSVRTKKLIKYKSERKVEFGFKLFCVKMWGFKPESTTEEFLMQNWILRLGFKSLWPVAWCAPPSTGATAATAMCGRDVICP